MEVASDGELLRPQGDCEHDLGFAQFRLNSFIAVVMGNFDVVEFFAETFCEPGWKPPEIEAVVDHHEHFHRS
jgi:hypothetical protein